MRILVINWQDIRNPYAGGAEVHCHEVFSRIAALGHDVTLFCSSFEGALPEETIEGIRIVRRGGRNTFNFVVPGAYRKRFRHENFDVVVDDLNKIPFFTPLYVREPLCGIAHHLFGTSIFREADLVTASYVFAMERAALRLYRSRRIPFSVVSPSTKNDLRMRGFDETLLHLNLLAVNHNVFRPTGVRKEDGPLIGYVGRIKKYKSIDHLLRVLPGVRAALPATRLVVVGEGDDRPRLQRLTRDLGLEDAVTFTGYVGEDEKVTWLQRMWCMVMPSSKEGWGLTVTEANACGTVAVASDVPGLRDAVVQGETGFLFPYGDLKKLALTIIGVLRNDGVRGVMEGKAMDFAAQFTWETAAEGTLALLQDVVQFQKSHATPNRNSLSNPGK